MSQQDFAAVGGSRIEDVASGQRLVIMAIVVNIASVVLQTLVGDVAGLVAIAAAVLAVVGLWRLGRGLGYSAAMRVGLLVLAIIPLIGLVMLVMVNARATKALRAKGYVVGLFGAKA